MVHTAKAEVDATMDVTLDVSSINAEDLRLSTHSPFGQ
jgi:hypothetical protein